MVSDHWSPMNVDCWSVLQVIPYHQSVDHNVYVAKIKRLKIRPKIRQLKLKIMQSAHYVVCDQTDYVGYMNSSDQTNQTRLTKVQNSSFDE